MSAGWLERLQGRLKGLLPEALLPTSLRPARATIPEALWSSTLARLPFLDYLNDDERQRLRTLC